jgi:hypothetical protein
MVDHPYWLRDQRGKLLKIGATDWTATRDTDQVLEAWWRHAAEVDGRQPDQIITLGSSTPMSTPVVRMFRLGSGMRQGVRWLMQTPSGEPVGYGWLHRVGSASSPVWREGPVAIRDEHRGHGWYRQSLPRLSAALGAPLMADRERSDACNRAWIAAGARSIPDPDPCQGGPQTTWLLMG